MLGLDMLMGVSELHRFMLKDSTTARFTHSGRGPVKMRDHFLAKDICLQKWANYSSQWTSCCSRRRYTLHKFARYHTKTTGSTLLRLSERNHLLRDPSSFSIDSQPLLPWCPRLVCLPTLRQDVQWRAKLGQDIRIVALEVCCSHIFLSY